MKKRSLFIGFLTFSFFILFSYMVHEDFFIQFDFNTTVRLQDNISRRFDSIFSFFSDIGAFEIMLGILLIVLVFLRKIRGIFALGFFGLFHLIELYGKFFVDHLPPPEFLLRTEKIINFPQFHVRLENSYPSGHAGRAAFLSIFIGLIVMRSNRISSIHKYIILSLLIAFDIIMLVSRVYLGEHWVSDITGGAILGASLGLLSFIFL